MMKSKSLQTGFLLKGNSYNYKIERVLGQGSFGITYLASVKMEGALGSIDVNIKVAIKEFFMRDINGRSDATVTSGSKGGIYDDYRRKFAREALNLSKLQHPNIIKVIESFEANNTIYYVMEFIGGGSLDDYIAKNNGIKEDEAIKIVKQIGSALSFMHKNKMLHLDLKPSNIMMKESGDIVLIDFGLSKQYDPNGEPESSTKVGAGTPGYAPIEQANYREGKGFPVTMDVYALGGTMFKMLTGVRPTEASDILNDGFPLYELQEHNISDRISGSVAKAMAPIKKDRFQSVGEFLQSIEDEITIIDTDIVTKKKVKEEINNSHPFIIKPQTKKVEISFLPGSPSYAGMYNAVIKRNGIQINDGINKSAWSLSQKSFTKFLDSLRLLNFEVRNKINPEYMEASEVAAKLTIKLYDENNSIYATYWIGGWKNQFGNIIGETLSINDRLIDVVPNLHEFLNHKDDKEDKEKPAQKSKKEKSILQIRPDTSKVRIEYWPYSLFPPRYNGAFITTVTPYEVNPNISQESTRELIPMTEGKFRNFLTALRALNLEIRDEVVEQFEPGSFSPAKLRIKLYGKSEEIYNDIWIDGRGGGNIEGEVDVIEKQIIRIVPGLAKYLNGPFYEVPNILKEWEILKKYPKSVTATHIINTETSGNLLSYRLWALPILIIELLFAWFMLTQSREIHLDSDGRLLLVFYCFASFLCICYMFFARKSMATKKWKMSTYISTIACIANSCLLPIWNGSLTGAYFVLSIGLSLISSFTILIKKNN